MRWPSVETALKTVLNVLPAPALAMSGTGPLAGTAADADALEKLRKLAFAEDVPPPRRPEQMVIDTRLVQPDLPMDGE